MNETFSILLGFFIMAAIIVGATIGLGPSVRAARRFAEQHFATPPVDATTGTGS